jgi:hypothetical protein
MNVNEVQEAKRLRDENARLRKLVANLSLGKEALRSVIEKTTVARRDEGCRRAYPPAPPPAFLCKRYRFAVFRPSNLA